MRTMRSVISFSLIIAALMVVVSGCSGAVSGSSPPTTSLNQPRAAEVIVSLKAATSASQASNLTKRLANLRGGITGTDWNYRSPHIVRVYLDSSETLGELYSLLPAIKKMPHVAGATFQLG